MSSEDGRVSKKELSAAPNAAAGMRVSVDISPGELYDKLTILSIKQEKILDRSKLASAECEKRGLEAVARSELKEIDGLEPLVTELRRINEALWRIEDEIRDHESRSQFNEKFIELARSVYFTNDERAAVKRRINELFGSDIGEVKSYRPYSRG